MPSTQRSRWRAGRCRVGDVAGVPPASFCVDGSQGHLRVTHKLSEWKNQDADVITLRLTTQRYIRLIERFAQHFHCSPDRLGLRHIREYQAQLFTVRKLTPGSVTNHLCALRFLYIQTLKRPWSIADTPYPKKRYRLPTILGQEEVTLLIEAAPTPFYRTILMTLYGTGVRRTELTRLKVSDIDSRRRVVHIQGGKGGQDRDVMLSPALWQNGVMTDLNALT